MLKILYIVSTLKRTGPTNQLYNIIKYLDPKLFSPSILTLSPESEDSMLESYNTLGVRISSLGLSRLQGLIKGARKLREYVKEIGPDLIHTQGIRADILSAYHLKKTKRVATLRNYPYQDYIMKFGKLRGVYMAHKHLRALQQIDCPVVCSQSNFRLLSDKHGLKFKVIQNGVDGTFFSVYSIEEKNNIRKKLGLSIQGKIFISVGALIARKDPITLIKAFFTGGVDGENILIMVGDGQLRPKCHKAVKGRTNVHFMGQISNVNEYLRAADYFVSTSTSEGLPNAVLEALSVGLPVCLSDIEPHREILNCEQGAGKLASVGDIKEFSDGIKALTKNNYAHASRAAVSIAHNHFNAQKMSVKYQDLYEGLM